VIEVLEHDHREVEQMFAELESLRGASTEEAKSRRRELTDDVTIELVRHSVAEEVLTARGSSCAPRGKPTGCPWLISSQSGARPSA
jgi:hypothetical protein